MHAIFMKKTIEVKLFLLWIHMHILTYRIWWCARFLSRRDPDKTMPIIAHLASSAPCLGIICRCRGYLDSHTAKKDPHYTATWVDVHHIFFWKGKLLLISSSVASRWYDNVQKISSLCLASHNLRRRKRDQNSNEHRSIDYRLDSHPRVWVKKTLTICTNFRGASTTKLVLFILDFRE